MLNRPSKPRSGCILTSGYGRTSHSMKSISEGAGTAFA